MGSLWRRVHRKGERQRSTGRTRSGRLVADEGCATAEVRRGGTALRDATCGHVHLADLVMVCENALAVLCLERVDVDGAVA